MSANLERTPSAERSIRLLTEAGAALAAPLDCAETLRTAAGLAVPGIADWSWLDVADPSWAADRAAAAAADAASQDLLGELLRRFPLDPDAPGPAGRALRTGEPILVAEVGEPPPGADPREAEQAALLRRLGVASLIAAPVPAHGRTLGVLTLASGPGRGRYGQPELALAIDLARRIGLALECARLRRELQQALGRATTT